MWSLPNLLALLGAGMLGASAIAQPAFDFMPDGGRELLLRHVGPGSLNEALFDQIIQEKRTKDEWLLVLTEKVPALSPRQAETLASYIAVNMPIAEAAASRGAPVDAIAAGLPADGKELALQHCQFCHSLFTGYLMQDRDVDGWLSTFKAPFHKEIKMSERERETFARYSALNMPLKLDDVPEELRF